MVTSDISSGKTVPVLCTDDIVLPVSESDDVTPSSVKGSRSLSCNEIACSPCNGKVFVSLYTDGVVPSPSTGEGVDFSSGNVIIPSSSGDELVSSPSSGDNVIFPLSGKEVAASSSGGDAIIFPSGVKVFSSSSDAISVTGKTVVPSFNGAVVFVSSGEVVGISPPDVDGLLLTVPESETIVEVDGLTSACVSDVRSGTE